MNQFVILSKTSRCHTKDGNMGHCLLQNINAFYNSDYHPGGNWRINGTIENLICTFKNDITRYRQSTLNDACKKLYNIIRTDLPEILRMVEKTNLRVCVIPRAKKESSYRKDQLYFRTTIRYAVHNLNGFEDGTCDIIRHTDTATTHLARHGNGGAGDLPYVGITKDTCNISNDIINKDILLIDDLYTKTVNIDEDCIQALIDKGANSVFFYSIGKTLLRF